MVGKPLKAGGMWHGFPGPCEVRFAIFIGRNCRSRKKPRERRSALGNTLFLCVVGFVFKGF